MARSMCLRLLTAAPRTRAQLAAALHRRAVPAEVAQQVLDRLSDVGLVDDAAYAQAWVRSRHAGRGLARRALAAELRQRGVHTELVAAVVDELQPDQEAATARALVDRKLATMRRLPVAVRERRLAAMLARKGYGSGLAYRVVREALTAEAGRDETWRVEAAAAYEATPDLSDDEP